MISKLLLLIIIVGVLFFLYKRKNSDNDTHVTKDDSNGVHTKPSAEESRVTEDEIVSPASELATTEADSNTDDDSVVTAQVATPEAVETTTAPQSEVQLDWANANLTKALEQYHAASNPEETYTSVTATISECYKQRKSQQYLIYGYSLAERFNESFQHYLSYRSENNITTALKGTAFMQLATLAQDNGNFDHAIDICRTAIANDLSDGTVTGFEGRIKRIEKAKEKATS